MHQNSIHEATQSHSQDWRQRAAHGWRARAVWARLQGQYWPEWIDHAVWCEAQALREEHSQDNT